MKAFSRLQISSTSPNFFFFKKALLQATLLNGAFNSENITSHLYRQNQQVRSPERRRDLWQCLDLLEACLSPPVPRNCGEQAFLSCCCCCSCLTLLPCSCHLSFLVWVLTSFWGSRIQHQGLCAGPSMPHSHCSPQGPGQGAAARPSVSPGAVTGRLRHTWETPPAPPAQRGVSSGGRGSSCCCLWPLFLFWTLRSPLSSPPQTDAGAGFDFLD